MTLRVTKGFPFKEPSLIFEVFEELRRQGLPLGLTEYLTLATAAEEGHGLESYAQFKRLCRLLWATSTDDYALIDQAFVTIVDPWLEKEPVVPDAQAEAGSTPAHGARTGEQTKRDQMDSASKSQGKESLSKDSPSRQPRTFPLGGVQTTSFNRSRRSSARRFVMTPRWPVPLRTLATTWRVLRQPRRQGPPVEWDVEGTLHQFAQTGLFLGPVFQAAKTNQAQLLLLIDQGGSMVPFSPLVSQIKDSLRLGGYRGRFTPWYFHDVPHPRVYARPMLVNGRLLPEVLAQQPGGSHLVIVSDAGAACGTWESRRLEQTKQVLTQIIRRFPNPVWLNPMPKDRWPRTTAGALAKEIPMVSWTAKGFRDLVNHLRGMRRLPLVPGQQVSR